MRILFTADSQVGAGTELGNGREYGPGSRFSDQVDVLERIKLLAWDEDVDQVVHLGDVFEYRTPTPPQIIAAQDFILSVPGNPIVLQGNHDVKSMKIPTASQILGMWGGDAITGTDVVQTPCLIARGGDDRVMLHFREGELGVSDGNLEVVPDETDLGDVVFACLPWTPMSHLLATGEADRSNLRTVATEALVSAAQELRIRCGEQHPDKTPILIGHWAVSGAKLPQGGAVEEMLTEPVIPWVELDTLGYALCAFGHIHEPQVIAAGQASTPMFYAGSPAVVNWGEADSPHGVWVYDTVGPRLRFVPVADRRFTTLNVDFYDGHDFSMLYERYGDFDPTARTFEGAVVRVKYRCDETVKVDEATVRQVLLECGATKVVVKGTVERASRARVEIGDEAVDPTQALEIWLASNETNGRVDLVRAQHAAYVEATG